jgi:hypothetical protein
MEIPDTKARLTLAQVLSHYGLKPDKQQRLCCPFHEDRTPSLQLYYKTHTCYCFSSNCKTHGKSLDVIDFILGLPVTGEKGRVRKGCFPSTRTYSSSTILRVTLPPLAVSSRSR